jgi:predicted nucleic acid-binding Zn ribbon protein
MSDQKNKNDELKDIDLCYKALGLSIGDSPQQVESTYTRLMEIYKNNMKSPDGHVRQEAKNNMELIADMYANIKDSVTYQAMEREYAKKGKLAESGGKGSASNNEALLQKGIYKECPSCQSVISKTEKKCPKCKEDLTSGFERFRKDYLTKTNVIVFSVLLIIIIIAVVGFMFSSQIMEIINPPKLE